MALLELYRQSVAGSAVEPLRVVEDLDVVEDRHHEPGHYPFGSASRGVSIAPGVAGAMASGVGGFNSSPDDSVFFPMWRAYF